MYNEIQRDLVVMSWQLRCSHKEDEGGAWYKGPRGTPIMGPLTRAHRAGRPPLALRSSAAMCVDPYLLPEHQSCSQDAQDTQEADEAKEQELLGGPGGLPVACV